MSEGRIERRTFLLTAGAVLLAPRGADAQRETDPPSRLRTIAYNVLKMTGYPANQARQAVRDLRREMPRNFAQALRRFVPDVIALSESPDEPIVADLARALGMRYVFFESGEDWPGAIMTRYEIVESTNAPMRGGTARPEDLFTRHWGAVTLDTPGGRLRVHSVHLHPSDPEVRMREVQLILESVQRDAESAPVLVQGDFNFTPNTPEYEAMKNSGLVDTFSAKGQGFEFTFSSEKPSRRIDYIWATPKLAESLIEARVIFDEPFKRDATDPDSYALSDHLPVMGTFGR